jgi:hypothetical protein
MFRYAQRKKMFSNYYTTPFFDQGPIVMIRLLPFLFFAIVFEDGQFTSLQYQKEKTKLSRPLSTRVGTLGTAVRYIGAQTAKNQKIAGSFGNALLGVVLQLGCIARSSLELSGTIKHQLFFGTLVSLARHLVSETSNYFAHNYFSPIGPRNRDKHMLL